ncbi:MAG: bifunctional 2-C-methyl-D-erythritol 4-phosphate cytidylyltransferase/2-C-methyl-D-erythritol 2,4-cyclodiphosphate synthase [Alphaproteobacteria bacterium]|nr:bifunctional 2-C-methyl-D-erythritol 4-phosphate cytidylyltransferase/2-C-methyl-D-erythritol 2,4-cyclodiphosphate synthase [Alphaproteobacteria bacterium]
MLTARSTRTTKTPSGPICAALIVAAGRGRRFGESAPAPKQYLALNRWTVLGRAAAAFLAHPRIGLVRVVIHGDDRAHYEQATRGLGLAEPVLGGRRRQDSVRLGLESLGDIAPDTVLIHDAARPLVDGALIDRVLTALDEFDGAVPALAIADTLKLGSGGVITGGMPRDGVFRAQTPQGFRFRAILDAHRRAEKESGEDFTDDAAIAAFAGVEVALVAGTESNFKITTDDDLGRARAVLAGASPGETRTGQGFDMHGFDAAKPGPVRVCGVDVPHPQALAGHSDSDVGLHAATDALLGAIAAGDIGEHFSPSDPKWKGADSEIFLRHAAALVAAAGGRIVHLDLTVICEAPKIAPHRDSMRRRVAEILGVDPARVSIKATTTEGLGALGRGEGIAAQAIATVNFGGGG